MNDNKLIEIILENREKIFDLVIVVQ